MARIARVVIPGCPHHIVQRGNQQQTVFFSDGDRGTYLSMLRDHCHKWNLRVPAGCLMSNHVHLVTVPEKREALARGVGRTNCEYAQWLHFRQRLSGHVWQNRYYSCTLDERHCWEAVRYVELNPVRAGFVRQAGEWLWSSAEAHLQKETAGI